MTCLIALEMWAPCETPFVVSGDNLGALNDLSRLKGGGQLVAVAREISWRQAARRWAPIPVHKPAELNLLADALSRLEAPDGSERKPFPPCLAHIPRTESPILEELWHCGAPPPPKPAKAKHSLRKKPPQNPVL